MQTCKFGHIFREAYWLIVGTVHDVAISIIFIEYVMSTKDSEGQGQITFSWHNYSISNV